MQRQTTQVYGQDRLAFFGYKETVSAAPVVVVIKGEDAILPVGSFHGVKKGAQFATFSPAPDITLSIDWIDDFKCATKVTPDISHALQRHNELLPSRWSLEGETLKIFVQLSLGNRFQELLYASLQDRISGCIEVTNGSSGDAHFKLNKREADGSIDISGPVSLIGYEGFVRCLDIRGKSDDVRATESALALSHLFRFGQILDLRSKASQDIPFEVNLNSDKNASNGRTFINNERVKFTFENQGKADLHFVVLALSPGFHVKQVYPPWDSPMTVRGSKTHSFGFKMRLPDEVRKGHAADKHRDIIRTVVSRKQQFSVKSLELPDIWDSKQIERPRDASLMPDTSNVDWWIKDIETHTAACRCWGSRSYHSQNSDACTLHN